jgi:hypothetical protein
MRPNSVEKVATPPHRIELNLHDISQLFNTMDPSPFHEKDLDHDAEEFILSWAREFPLHEPIALVVHLAELPQGSSPQPLVEQAIHHYFAYRAKLNWMDFRHLMREGWQSLLIGLFFLAACLAATQAIGQQQSGTLLSLMRESLLIGGWVAMWRPMEIYLYEWWPLHRRGRIYEKLSQIPVEVRLVMKDKSHADGTRSVD